jgi:hypothetical protein
VHLFLLYFSCRYGDGHRRVLCVALAFQVENRMDVMCLLRPQAAVMLLFSSFLSSSLK